LLSPFSSFEAIETNKNRCIALQVRALLLPVAFSNQMTTETTLANYDRKLVAYSFFNSLSKIKIKN
jgi:hypothetical protein